MASEEPTRGETRKDTHSRVVRVLRWVLPLVALILLASIFVLSNSSKLQYGLILADSKLAELAVGQKITNPQFSGVTRGGDAFTIAAEWALPDAPKPERIELSKPRTTIDFESGRALEVAAGSGLLNLETSEATLADEVNVITSSGFVATSSSLLMNFRTGNLSSGGPVHADSPMGTIDAGSMTLTQDLDENPAGQAVLQFTKSVKLVYKPNEE